MTREQQVRAALKLSKLPRDKRDRYEAARASIENALDIMVDATLAHNVWKAARSKAAHKAERAYHQALRRLGTTYKAALTTGAGVPLYPTLAHIESAIKATEPPRYELLYRARGTKPTFAVALAYELLMEWWGNDEFITTTRKGTWWRLSAILYGDTDADLFQYLRAFKPELSPFPAR